MRNKRRKEVWMEAEEAEEELIPGLPNHISQLCLSRVPPSLLFRVCSRWRRLLYSPLFPPFLSLYALLFPTSSADAPVQLMSFDPLAGNWLPLPPPPHRILLRHPSFISRRLPVQSLSVSGTLLLLAATDDRLLPALPLPLVFSPHSGSWSHGPALPASRRWCAAGKLSGSVYVASGMGSRFSSEVARSFHRWAWEGEGSASWESLAPLKHARFSREPIQAVGCRGSLWVVDAAKRGAIYHPHSASWEDMPEPMLRGWTGPAAAMAEDQIYALDDSKGILTKWDWDLHRWQDLLHSPLLRGARHISASSGKICAVVHGGARIVVVDVATAPPKLCVLETPPGFEAVALHILPRMSRN